MKDERDATKDERDARAVLRGMKAKAMGEKNLRKELDQAMKSADENCTHLLIVEHALQSLLGDLKDDLSAKDARELDELVKLFANHRSALEISIGDAAEYINVLKGSL
jgi:hypothetical protein